MTEIQFVYSLYIGSRDGKSFSYCDRKTVRKIVGDCFDCFTLIDADGYFQGRGIATLVVKIATDDSAKVTDTARSFGQHLRQLSIGLEVNGRYEVITMD